MSAFGSLHNEQFHYHVSHSASEGVTTVSAEEPISGRAVGAVAISRDTDPSDRERDYYAPNGYRAGKERGGDDYTAMTAAGLRQQRWSGGSFEEQTPDKLSWASVLPGTNPAVLRNMLGVAVHEHGRVPVADDQLTGKGSRFSRAMSKKYGIKGHPHNPDMHPNLVDYDQHDVEGATEHFHAYASGEVEGMGPDDLRARQLPERQAQAMGRSIRPNRTPKPDSSEQLRLF